MKKYFLLMPLQKVVLKCFTVIIISILALQIWNYKLRRCLFTLLGHLDYIRTTFFHHVSNNINRFC